MNRTRSLKPVLDRIPQASKSEHNIARLRLAVDAAINLGREELEKSNRDRTLDEASTAIEFQSEPDPVDVQITAQILDGKLAVEATVVDGWNQDSILL